MNLYKFNFLPAQTNSVTPKYGWIPVCSVLMKTHPNFK